MQPRPGLTSLTPLASVAPLQSSDFMKGTAPMQPRGNAAVEQQPPKKDPFADLLS